MPFLCGQLVVAQVLWGVVATAMVCWEPITSGCCWGQQWELCARLQAAAVGRRPAVCRDGLPGKIFQEERSAAFDLLTCLHLCRSAAAEMEAPLPGVSLLLVLLAAGWGSGAVAAWATSPGGCELVSPLLQTLTLLIAWSCPEKPRCFRISRPSLSWLQA